MMISGYWKKSSMDFRHGLIRALGPILWVLSFVYWIYPQTNFPILFIYLTNIYSVPAACQEVGGTTRPGMLRFMGSQRVGHVWATEMNWTELKSNGKESACSAGDPGSILGSGRSLGEGNGNPVQYSCLENPMDRGAWQATVHGVAKSWTRQSN